MNVVLLDAYNLIYRARYSFAAKGEYGTVYSFFRSLRALLERLGPDKVYFVLEGVPRARLEIHPSYKANRVRDVDVDFREHRKIIIDMMSNLFPVHAVRHPEQECDDVIAFLVKKHTSAGDSCVVVSTDTDFLQLYNTCPGCRIYNPIKKKFAEPPVFDYVTWKSLRGDSSDNIQGIRGIGNKRATTLVSDPLKLEELLVRDNNRDIFEKNMSLIRFSDINENDLEYSHAIANWDEVKDNFGNMKFTSITNPKSWIKFMDTFNNLN